MANSNRTFNNFFWKFLERTASQGVSFVVSIILARLLAPDVYGTIALVTVFTNLLYVFVNSGMGTALVQKKDADELDFSTLFFFNIGMCLSLYAALFFAAPLVASFYGDPELTPVVRVLGLTLVIFGVKGIQTSYVSKNLIFKKFFYSTLIGTVLSAVVGIIMAYQGFGVWALVAQQLVNELIGTIVLWITVPFRPKWQFSFGRLKRLFSYGWKLLVSSLIETLYNDVRQLIIGKLYSSDDLAYYNRGKQYPNLIVTNVNTSIDSVLLPTMSREQDDRARVKAMTRRAIRISSYIMAPLMIGLAVCAKPIITLLLTEKWLNSVLFMQIFCITYMFFPIHTANLNAIKAMGRSDLFLKMEIVKKIIGFGLIFATMFISVEAMAYSLLINTLTSTLINAFPNKRLLGYSWLEQMKDILPNIGLAVLMGVAVFFISYLPLPLIVTLVLQIVTGALIYIALSATLKLEIFQYLLNIIKGYLKRKKA